MSMCVCLLRSPCSKFLLLPRQCLCRGQSFFFFPQKILTGLFIIVIKLNCWNVFTETFLLASMLYILHFY
jgi:hypothetical protein